VVALVVLRAALKLLPAYLGIGLELFFFGLVVTWGLMWLMRISDADSELTRPETQQGIA
jgi:hypothetical protein